MNSPARKPRLRSWRSCARRFAGKRQRHRRQRLIAQRRRRGGAADERRQSRELGLPVLAALSGRGGGVDPAVMGIGPSAPARWRWRGPAGAGRGGFN
jgi:hypothetical protein